MASAIDERCRALRREGRMGLMTHIVAGYPSPRKTVPIARAMVRGGADFLEVQIPFSDPLADGPTIMGACERALANGMTTKKALAIASELSSGTGVPIVLMAYYNTVFRHGTARFCADAKAAGVGGLIVPDMPLEEEAGEHFMRSCKASDIYNIRVVSPASTDLRLRKNARGAQGFMYCTARQGITGARRELDPNLSSYLRRIKRVSSIPIAVGFGISSRAQVQALSGHAEIAVVGSAIIQVIERQGRGGEERAVERFVMGLRRG